MIKTYPLLIRIDTENDEPVYSVELGDERINFVNPITFLQALQELLEQAEYKQRYQR